MRGKGPFIAASTTVIEDLAADISRERTIGIHMSGLYTVQAPKKRVKERQNEVRLNFELSVHRSSTTSIEQGLALAAQTGRGRNIYMGVQNDITIFSFCNRVMTGNALATRHFTSMKGYLAFLPESTFAHLSETPT